MEHLHIGGARMAEHLPDINQIRRRNLWLLVHRAGGIPELAEAMGVTRQRVHALMRPNSEVNIGEPFARRIEAIYSLQKNWMDHEHRSASDPAMVVMLEKIERAEANNPAEVAAMVRTIFRSYNKWRTAKLAMQALSQENEPFVQNESGRTKKNVHPATAEQQRPDNVVGQKDASPLTPPRRRRKRHPSKDT